MTLDVVRLGRGGAGQVIEAMTRWTPRHGPVLGLHAGDVGWHLRLDDDVLAGSLLLVTDGLEPVAVALVELSGSMIRPVIKPDRWDDLAVAAALADAAESLPATVDSYTDAPSHSAYRTVLSARGWEVDPDAWAVLHRAVGRGDGEYHDDSISILDSEADISDRVAVQVAAFDRSTFTVDRWHQMAAGPGFDRRLDLLRRASDGTPVAAGTGWLAEPGRAGILEPVGTHRDHVGAGHGKAVTRALIAALARTGASGVSVQTPLSNTVAIGAYRSCGLRVVEHLHAMVRRVPATATG